MVTSFVLPHVGGVEQFVAFTADNLRTAGWSVRVLSSSLPNGESAQADVVIPTIHLFRSDHPIPYRGLVRLWREIGRADVIVVNQHRNFLPVFAALLASLRGRPAIFVIHGAPGVRVPQPRWFRAIAGLFDRTLGRLALKRSVVATLSESGRNFDKAVTSKGSATSRFRSEFRPSVAPKPLRPGEAARAVWAGRLYPQKDPELAIRAVEGARRERDVTLDMYGDGFLKDRLVDLAGPRP
jgi:glycosyltransferase involved in cell wall biosynthesis